MVVVKKKKERADVRNNARHLKRKDDENRDDGESDVADLEPIEVHVVPEDQIKGLTDEQLGEEFTKALSTNNPKALSQIVNYHVNDGTFQAEGCVDQIAVHFFMEETIVHIKSDEASISLEKDKVSQVDKIETSDESSVLDENKDNQSTAAETDHHDDVTLDVKPSVPTTDPSINEEASTKKALKNQFNFSERASQTFNNPIRDRMIATDPPPTIDFSGECSQCIIFDAYLKALRQAKEAKIAKDKIAARTSKRGENNDDDPTADLIFAEDDTGIDRAVRVMSSVEMSRSLKTIERIVSLNAEDEIFNDFKHFDDNTDSNRVENTGIFLPLWRFAYSKAKNKTVTAIKWNPHYPDLFAVAYGSYNFMQQHSDGLICCFSLKNTAYPEFLFTTSCGVMTIDFHPQHPALLAVGLYNGTVAVYDVRVKNNEPIYKSMDPKVKHTGPVWQVHWQQEDLAKDINFFSISSDGRVTNWIMSKNELVNEEVMELKFVSRNDEEVNDDAVLVGMSSGTCFDFNKVLDHLFVVGTDEGLIHKCSKAYSSEYLQTFSGHQMAVYAVKWNPFHARVFASCSADWTLRIWDANQKEPLLSFDLGTAVGDVCWAPFSSTVLATVSADGKVFVFDLNVNKNQAIGMQRVLKKGKLTHVEFNPIEPVLLVGDDRGGVVSLKLSSKLRKLSSKSKDKLNVTAEHDKLESILVIASNKDQ